jgi:hypothetical protein
MVKQFIDMEGKFLLKFTIFLELLIMFIYGCVWLVLYSIGVSAPFIVLPIAMLAVLFCCLLSIIIIPIADKFLK